MGKCDPGLKKTRTLEVADEHTAVALGSGEVAVLGTPALLALAEGACVDAIADDLPDGQTPRSHPSRVRTGTPVPPLVR
jgi:fluoroacetyl-CoA thioesterase